jgi:hypothetical protein
MIVSHQSQQLQQPLLHQIVVSLILLLLAGMDNQRPMIAQVDRFVVPAIVAVFATMEIKHTAAAQMAILLQPYAHRQILKQYAFLEDHSETLQ